MSCLHSESLAEESILPRLARTKDVRLSTFAIGGDYPLQFHLLGSRTPSVPPSLDHWLLRESGPPHRRGKISLRYSTSDCDDPFSLTFRCRPKSPYTDSPDVYKSGYMLTTSSKINSKQTRFYQHQPIGPSSKLISTSRLLSSLLSTTALCQATRFPRGAVYGCMLV